MAANIGLLAGIFVVACGLVMATPPHAPEVRRSKAPVEEVPDFMSGPATRSLNTCCGDLGCFSSGGDFFMFPDRPINSVPLCDLTDKLKFHLNTRANPNVLQTQVISALDSSIPLSNFDPTKKIQITIHGFIDNFRWPWWTQVVNALLKNGDYNVIRLDWNWGNLPPYFQASANVRLVGRFVAHFINHLVKQYGVDPADIHIIGHSLGAHGAGYTGQATQELYGFKIGQITGLDPAGPYFTKLPATVRLDPSDATAVITIVTDGETILDLALGSPQPMGHVNFFPNGGLKQTGCKKSLAGLSTIWLGTTMDSSLFSPIGTIAATALETFACNHARAPILFYESINSPSCAMKSYECGSYEKFLRGECFNCNGGKCADLGFHADIKLAKSGQVKNYYTVTTGKAPFCTSPHKLEFTLQSSSYSNGYNGKKDGKVWATLYGSQATSERVLLTPEDVSLAPGKKYTFFFETTRQLGDIRQVVLYWEVDTFLLNPIDWIRTHYIYIQGDILVTEHDGKASVLTFSNPKIQSEKDALARLSYAYQQ